MGQRRGLDPQGRSYNRVSFEFEYLADFEARFEIFFQSRNHMSRRVLFLENREDEQYLFFHCALKFFSCLQVSCPAATRTRPRRTRTSPHSFPVSTSSLLTHTTGRSSRLPHTTGRSSRLPHTTGIDSRLPHTTGRSSRLPHKTGRRSFLFTKVVGVLSNLQICAEDHAHFP